jgi:hypothetical protein
MNAYWTIPLQHLTAINNEEASVVFLSTRPSAQAITASGSFLQRPLLTVSLPLPRLHLWADCLENVGASTSHNRMGLHGSVTGIALPFYLLKLKETNCLIKPVYTTLVNLSWYQKCVFEVLGCCYDFWLSFKELKKNSMVWVRERTIPTERPPLVGEVIANFCG